MIELTDRDKKMLKLWDEGYSASQVGIQINMTRNAVMGRIGRLRVAGFVGYKTAAPPIHRISNRENYKSKISEQMQFVKDEIRELIKTKKQAFRERVGISLMELSSQTCKYSISGDSPELYKFCGKQVWKKSYCETHHYLCYVPSDARKKTNKIEFRLKKI